MRARALLVGIAACALGAAACADLIGIDTYVYQPGGDASIDAARDAATDDASAEGAPPDAETDGAAACTPCTGPGPAVCGLSCAEDGPTLLAQDMGKVYWIVKGAVAAAELRAAPKTGAAAAAKTADLQGPVVGLTQSGGYVVWTTGTALSAIALDGGATLPLLTGLAQVSALAASPPPLAAQPFVFWSVASADGGIRRCLLPGCAGSQILQIDQQGSPAGLVVGYDKTSGGGPYGLWVNEAENPPALRGARVTGGYVVTLVAQNTNLVPVLAVDPSDSSVVYYASSTGVGSRVTRAGQADVYATATGAVRAMAAQGNGLWIAVADLSNPKKGKLVSVAFPSGTITEVATEQDSPEAVAVDATYVYWTVRGTAGATGRVMRAGR